VGVPWAQIGRSISTGVISADLKLLWGWSMRAIAVIDRFALSALLSSSTSPTHAKQLIESIPPRSGFTKQKTVGSILLNVTICVADNHCRRNNCDNHCRNSSRSIYSIN
jgi:hypothetical protein